MTTREQFVAEARTWIGVPFVHQGRNRLGVDCIGLVLVVCRALGLSDADPRGYGRAPNGAALLRGLAQYARPLRPDEAQAGDLLLMRFLRDPQHVGIATDHGILHAYGGAGRVVETSLPPSWRRRIVRAYGVPGVN